ncbi:MAG: serine/threonine protein kinase, partial [Bryobacterales bacterium]|nr:serine/threonine protein kinase [Bryobacterales bacterium]
MEPVGADLPKLLGKYELVEFLGGGMSHVYRAVDTVLGRTVAVKILLNAYGADPDARIRFLNEAKVAASLIHENVISVYDFGQEEGLPYLVMEFLHGQSLRKLIGDGRPLSLVEKLHIALQTARAVEYVHGRGVVHRDIKP